jgi:hypothetical protein
LASRHQQEAFLEALNDEGHQQTVGAWLELEAAQQQMVGVWLELGAAQQEAPEEPEDGVTQ